mgnify:CR=1 FL=1
MQEAQLIEELKLFIMENRLPLIDMALFGVLCPLCGKTDRIRELDPPEKLKASPASQHPSFNLYIMYWQKCTDQNLIMGVCKFCNSPLKLNIKEMKANLLYDLNE